ncbi:hypothetical protein [Celerinatantimonas yamalensis]|uniref:Uncharacterized protein n=1 Tax=Celerinatantimonas yamalensis TaxID=559956 RepID=A0ABW9G3Q2_9GAMM
MPSSDLILPIIPRPTGPPLRQVKAHEDDARKHQSRDTDESTSKPSKEASSPTDEPSTAPSPPTDHEIDLFV